MLSTIWWRLLALMLRHLQLSYKYTPAINSQHEQYLGNANID
jgi:hypothetical protein